MSRRADPGRQMIRALAAIGVCVRETERVPWADGLYVGARHRLVCGDVPALPLLARIAEVEFDLADHILLEIAHRYDAGGVVFEAVTLECG